MTTTVDDHAAIDRTLTKIYALQDLDGFITTSMRELPLLIDAEKSGYNEVNYAQRRMMTIINSPTAQKWYHKKQIIFEAIMTQNPLIDHYSRVLDGPRKISDFLSHKQWQATAIYKAYYKTIGAEYQIASVLPVEEASLVAFAFNRSRSDFTERHRAILSTVQPHLTQAYKNARQHTQTKARLARSELALETIGAGWIDLNGDLEIVDATPLARSNLKTFFKENQTNPGQLPPSVKKWVVENIDQARTGAAIAPLVVENEIGRLILRILAAGSSGEFSLFSERFLDASSPKPLAQLGLTHRQAEVLYWICQGKSNAEIAIILKIRIRTVIFHISRIFETLGVTNRTEAANLATAHLTSRR
jgi:DNA-binding CsgD family transcriptional regulator